MADMLRLLKVEHAVGSPPESFKAKHKTTYIPALDAAADDEGGQQRVDVSHIIVRQGGVQGGHKAEATAELNISLQVHGNRTSHLAVEDAKSEAQVSESPCVGGDTDHPKVI